MDPCGDDAGEVDVGGGRVAEASPEDLDETGIAPGIHMVPVKVDGVHLWSHCAQMASLLFGYRYIGSVRINVPGSSAGDDPPNWMRTSR